MALSNNYFTWAFVLLISVAIGVFSALNPLIALLPIGVLVLFLLLKYPTLRMYYITLGSFFVLGGENFTTSKAIFLAGIAVVTLGSLLNVKKQLNDFKSLSKLFIACMLFSIYVLISILFSVTIKNVNVISALRDGSSYILFGLSPLFALDFAGSVSFKKIKRTFYILFILGTIYFAYGWILRRGYINLPEPSIGYISFLLPLSFFAFCSANALRGGKKRMLWLLMSTLVLVSMLITGTRTSIIVLIAPLLITFMGFKGMFVRSFRLVIFGLGIVSIGAAMFILMINFTNIDGASLLGKLDKFSAFTSQTNLSNDGSFQDRSAQTQITLDSFKENPIMGIGVGNGYFYNGQTQLSVDSPLSLPAKFGIVGMLVLLGTYLSMVGFIKKMDNSVTKYALIGFMAITTALLFLASPIEDKGFSLSLVLLLTYALKENNEILRNQNE